MISIKCPMAVNDHSGSKEGPSISSSPCVVEDVAEADNDTHILCERCTSFGSLFNVTSCRLLCALAENGGT